MSERSAFIAGMNAALDIFASGLPHVSETEAESAWRRYQEATSYTATEKARFCNQAGPMGGGCADSWHVGGNYGSHVCRNPNHHDEPELRTIEGETVEPPALPDHTVILLSLAGVGAHGITEASLGELQTAVDEWDHDQREAAADWAARVHLHASDNDDIEVPETPPHVDELDRRLREAHLNRETE